MRGWHARGEAGGVIVNTRGVDAHIDDAVVKITTLGMHRVTIHLSIRYYLGYRIAVVFNCYSRRFNFRRAMRTVTFRNCSKNARLQRKTYPHSSGQAEQSGPGGSCAF